MLASGPAATDTLLLDNFTDEQQRSALGTRWQGFTDGVMGGLSEIEAGYTEGDEGRVLFMRGPVRLENNGGFIQVRLPLTTDRSLFDASAWTGIAVVVRGRPGPYYLHLRTAGTPRVWQYFSAPMPVTEDWQRVVVPFATFRGQYLTAPLDHDRLRSIAVVAYGEAFEAELEIARIELVRLEP
ncbi:MAG: CIA30 family protein [Gammaproteobacteria bacterium]|nr:CIA30 family protein [Gammaproteobacteria bacterium]